MLRREMRSIPTERNKQKEKQSEEIKKHVEAYLASGGEIDTSGFLPFKDIKFNFCLDVKDKKRFSDLAYKERHDEL